MMPAVDPSIAHLDWPVCQCESRACNRQCANEATVQATFHALHHCHTGASDIDADGNRNLELCQNCYDALRDLVAAYVVRLGRYGRPMCSGCAAPVRCVRDVLRKVAKL